MRDAVFTVSQIIVNSARAALPIVPTYASPLFITMLAQIFVSFIFENAISNLRTNVVPFFIAAVLFSNETNTASPENFTTLQLGILLHTVVKNMSNTLETKAGFYFSDKVVKEDMSINIKTEYVTSREVKISGARRAISASVYLLSIPLNF